MSTNHDYLYDLAVRIGLSDFQARTVQFIVERPLKILLILLGAWIVSRVGSRMARRAVRSLARRTPARATTARSELRTETLAGTIVRLIRLVVFIVAGLLILGVLGVNLTPLLAGAGVVGIAVGLGTQSLIRDMVAGMFIIGEDQYGVGDIIDINGQEQGVVEDVNLRSTRHPFRRWHGVVRVQWPDHAGRQLVDGVQPRHRRRSSQLRRRRGPGQGGGC